MYYNGDLATVILFQNSLARVANDPSIVGQNDGNFLLKRDTIVEILLILERG
jgi:hypothetical protein